MARSGRASFQRCRPRRSGLGLAIVPDPRPEAGSYYRSDHFSLSRVGIPAFSVDTGELYEGHDLAWGQAEGGL